MKRKIALCLVICILLSFTLTGCAEGSGNPLAIRIAGKNPWLDASNIVKVEEYVTYHGVAPRAYRTVYYAEDRETIDKIVNYYEWSFIFPTSLRKLERICGGGSRKVIFTLSDGSTEVLDFYHGCYTQGDRAYRVINTSYYDISALDTYSQLISQKDKCPVLRTNTAEPEKVGEVDVSSWKLKYIPLPEEALDKATVYIEIDFAKLYIISDTVCCLEEHNSGEYHYYNLLEGETFAPLIEMAVVETTED